MNRLSSTAVMARRVEPPDSLDFFPTPPWATRAFCEFVLPQVDDQPYAGDVFDPACGEGHMALALADYFALDRVFASDIFDYGFGAVADFLHPDYLRRADWIVTNPPFKLAEEFIFKALKLARFGVAMLCRTQFQEGEGRYERLYSVRPPALIAQYCERVPMHKGRWVVNGNTASAYEWFVWLVGSAEPTRFIWIPKSRQALSRHDDWLRFSGCVDIPDNHPARKIEQETNVTPRQAMRLAVPSLGLFGERI
jgi:hypothetical protein